MRARSALFDLYGDHIARRGGWAPVGGLVRVLEALDIAGPATRTAISRMMREDWLHADTIDGVRGYRVTDRATRQLDDAHRRIYDTLDSDWDGRWDVVVTEPVRSRAGRERVGAVLRYLGYAALEGTTWIAARRHSELADRLGREQVTWRGFASAYDGDDRELAARLWDLEEIAGGYRDFAARLNGGAAAPEPTTPPAGLAATGQPEPGRELPPEPPRAAFAHRARLVHRWRLFLFHDPGLPAQVLPQDWPRPAVAAMFRHTAADLLPGADAFVDDCLRRG